MTKTVLITGGAGFIGSGIVEHLHRKTKWDIVIIDKLTYASKGLERLRDSCLLDSRRIKIFTFDLKNKFTEGLIKELGNVNYILHVAAESHVDRSISHPVEFIENNVMSTVHTLEYARQLKNLELFFYMSTDEVYSSAPEGISYKEEDRHTPTNPYSASKSCGEKICMSYENTYKLPLIIVNCMNAYGERQHPEKFIPKCIYYILNEKTIPIHSDETKTKPGARSYIHYRNIADAILYIIYNGKNGESYNITGEKELNNLEMALFISNIIGKPLKYELVDFHSDRPGHDLYYRLDGSKLTKLGWKPPVNFENSLAKTIKWYLENPEWFVE